MKWRIEMAVFSSELWNLLIKQHAIKGLKRTSKVQQSKHATYGSTSREEFRMYVHQINVDHPFREFQ
jgi:hypothetical protein